jgi:hypothetical protein
MATIVKNPGRQEMISAVQKINGATLGAAGLAEAIQLPEGAMVVSAQLKVTEAFTGGADITLALSGCGVTLGATDADAAAINADATITAVRVGAGGDTVDVTSAGTTPTGGTAYVIVNYVVDNRACFSEG